MDCGEARIKRRHVRDDGSQSGDIEKCGEIDEANGSIDVENDVGASERTTHELERSVCDGSV